MTTEANVRKERIERLFRELTYEISIGVLLGEIEPLLGHNFVMDDPKSTNGDVIAFEARTRRIKREKWFGMFHPAYQLTVVREAK